MVPDAPHDVWQRIEPPGTHDTTPVDGFAAFYPAVLADGRQLPLPIRVLPGDGSRAVASLIVNQASFAVEDALGAAMADLAADFATDVVVGVPTLGLPLAAQVARRLGHPRMVALGTSRKFWYLDDLSEPLSSITTPQPGKRIFVDPRMLPLLQGRRVLVVDDVVSTGASMGAVLRLLARAEVFPVGVVAAMLQGDRWRGHLGAGAPPVVGALATPLLSRTAEGRWSPDR